MMKNKTRRGNVVLAAAIALVGAFGLGGPAHASTLYWNTNGTSATWSSANWGSSGSGPFPAFRSPVRER